MRKSENKQLQQEMLAGMTKSRIQVREKQYLRLKLMLDSVVLVEIGNRSTEVETKKSHFSKTKKKYNWELFVNEKPGFKFD